MNKLSGWSLARKAMWNMPLYKYAGHLIIHSLYLSRYGFSVVFMKMLHVVPHISLSITKRYNSSIGMECLYCFVLATQELLVVLYFFLL